MFYFKSWPWLSKDIRKDAFLFSKAHSLLVVTDDNIVIVYEDWRDIADWKRSMLQPLKRNLNNKQSLNRIFF